MIPALAFNNTNSPIYRDAVVVGESLAAASRKLNEYSALSQKQDFESKCSFIKINGLNIISGSANGVICEVEGHQAYDLLIPLSGHNNTTIDKVNYSFEAHNTSLFGVYEKHRTVSMGCVVALHLEPNIISKTCAAMFGPDYRPVLPSTSQVCSMEYYGISFSALFKSLFAQIDGAGSNSEILSKLALDDSFYRLCAGLLYPDIFLTNETRNGRRPYVRYELNRLCEYIVTHLTEAISLTQMEHISGLSARVLQHSFQNAFGLTPKKWVRKQRLHAAHKVMLNSKDPVSITALAYDFCFASPSDFANHYQQEFGELPSQTLKARNWGAL